MTGERPALLALATRLGIEPGYFDLGGTWRATSAATAEALCGAMGHDASSEAAAARSLATLDARARGRRIAPVRVFREHAGARPDLRVRADDAGAARCEIQVTDESGASRACETRLAPSAAGGRVSLPLPGPFAPGRYAILLRLEGEPEPLRQTLVVAPRTAVRVQEKIGDAKAWGLWTNLYALRGAAGLGFGDLSDLAAVLRWCGEQGGDFVGVNPLHAIPDGGHDVSPYSPTSRLYRNPLYLDVFAVPELAACEAARTQLARADVAAEIRRLREVEAIDAERIRAVAVPLWRALYACFRQRESRRPSARGERFDAYRAREGAALRDFATWEVLRRVQTQQDGRGAHWPDWPQTLRHPDAAEVGRFREAHADEIGFRCWLQFEVDEQLARACEGGRRAGLRIGLYQDLAVGSGAGSADSWMFPDAFARGVSMGAPPDSFAPEGQDWGLPPLDPHVLREDGYTLFARLLASAFRHAGALRIDHVMALQRQFWIPHGRPGSEGAYVRFPRSDLLGVLALESRRAGALVIGEDLGTVPPDLPGELASWGILSSCVYAFERDEHGFRSPERLSPRALATANTHDLAPLRGHLAGTDLVARRAAGAIASDAALANALRERASERADWISRLRAEGLLSADGEPEPEAIVSAVSALLMRSAAPLVGLSLDDLAGEEMPINLPGVGPERHPSWRRRMRAPLDSVLAEAAGRVPGRAAPTGEAR